MLSLEFSQNKSCSATILELKANTPLVSLGANFCASPSHRKATYFSHKFREVANAAGLHSHLFKQLRHSHLQQLERAQCSEQERNAHSGHTRASGNQLMDTSYGIERDEKLVASAVEKLEKMRETSLKLP